MRGFHFLATTDVPSGRSEELKRMISSIEAFAASGTAAVVVTLLLQRSSGSIAQSVAGTLPDFVDVHSIDYRVSSSRARNMLLKIAQDRLNDLTIFAFPDDDCWYPPGTLEGIRTAFLEPKLDFWFTRYSSEPSSQGVESGRPPKVQEAISRGACNTIFLRGSLVRKIGFFDERLGIGAQLDGGEDTDFSIRAFYSARHCLFVDRPTVGHRDFVPSHRARYFGGSYAVIALHAPRSTAGVLALARKSLVGIAMVARRQLPVKAFFAAVKAAVFNNKPSFPVD